MSYPKARAWVNRLLNGEFRTDDLTNLFLFARDHCDGREAVAEIGHFVAHHHERDKGIITRSTQEWFAVARYQMDHFGSNYQKPINIFRLPPATVDYFSVAINLLDPRAIKQNTGLKRGAAYQAMLKLIERLVRNPDGTWAFPTNYTDADIKMVECVSKFLVSKPAFEADQLVQDFIATLKSNGLLTKEEIREHMSRITAVIQLYAVAAMHNCVVQIGDGTTTTLKAQPRDQTIDVIASVPSAVPGHPTVGIATAMFSAPTNPAVYCHPDLLAMGAWGCELEVGPDMRLTPLV